MGEMKRKYLKHVSEKQNREKLYMTQWATSAFFFLFFFFHASSDFKQINQQIIDFLQFKINLETLSSRLKLGVM